MVTTGMLYKKAKEMANQYWGMNFDLPIQVNGRLTRALGRFMYNQRLHKPLRIEMAKELLERYDEDTIFDVLKHELTHWALFVQNKPHHDGDYVFEKELRRVGAASTNTIQPQGELHTIVCSKCGSVAAQKPTQGRAMKYTDPRYYSRCCKANLQYAGLHSYNPNKIINQKPQTPQPEPIKPVSKVQSSISELITPGPRGVTNMQMIPAIKKALDAGSLVQLQLLKQHYPEAYAGSLRYLGKTYTNKYNTLVAQRKGA